MSFSAKGSMIEYDPLKDNLESTTYMQKRQLVMLIGLLSSILGGYFNIYFQNFIQNQIQDYFSMDSSTYSWFVLIPSLPNIPLPLLTGPLVQVIGLRKGLFITTTITTVSLLMCIIATLNTSTLIIMIAKALLQIGVEAQGIIFGCLLGKWFRKNLTTAFTIGSLIAKATSSTSGIIYPQLVASDNSPLFPFIVGFIICAISNIGCIVACRIDSKYDLLIKNELSNTESNQSEPPAIPTFKLSDVRKFYGFYWYYVLLSPLMLGAYNSFTSYLQKVITTKFEIDKKEAGQLASIPFWVGFSTPLFGILTDRIGKRSSFLCLTTLFSSSAALLLLLLPFQSAVIGVIISLCLCGLFLSTMYAFLYPTIPFLSEKAILSTGFAIAFSSKNIGQSILSYVGGNVLGDNSERYDTFLLLFVCIFFLSFALSVVMYLVDRKNGGIINSKTPQKFIEIMKQKSLLRQPLNQEEKDEANQNS